MKKHGLTADDLKELVSQREESVDGFQSSSEDSHQGPSRSDSEANRTNSATNDDSGSTKSGNDVGTNRNGTAAGSEDSGRSKPGPSESTPSGGGQQTFRSYIAVQKDEQTDPDGLEHAERLALEKKSREFILNRNLNGRRHRRIIPDLTCTRKTQTGTRSGFVKLKQCRLRWTAGLRR